MAAVSIILASLSIIITTILLINEIDKRIHRNKNHKKLRKPHIVKWDETLDKNGNSIT